MTEGWYPRRLADTAIFELPSKVRKEAVLRTVGRPQFFLRIAELCDDASRPCGHESVLLSKFGVTAQADEAEKARLAALADNLASTLSVVVESAEERMDDASVALQEIVASCAEPDGEFLVPLASERFTALQSEVNTRVDKGELGEGVLSTVDAWAKKAESDGLDGMARVRAVAKPPGTTWIVRRGGSRRRRGCRSSKGAGRGDAARATWIVRGDAADTTWFVQRDRSRRCRGCHVNRPKGRIAATPRAPRGSSEGAVAATPRMPIVRRDGSRRRPVCHVDRPKKRVAATARLPRGSSEEAGRGDAARATWIVRRSGSRRRLPHRSSSSKRCSSSTPRALSVSTPPRPPRSSRR